MTSKLASMNGDRAIVRLSELYATADGPAVCDAALSVIGLAERKGRVSDEVAQEARIAFAGYPGVFPAEGLSLADRKLSAVKGAQLAMRRAEARDVSDRAAARGVNVSLEDLLEAGEDFSEQGEASGPTSLRRAMPYPAPDGLTRTRSADVLSLAMGAAQEAGVPAEVLSAVACPAESRKTRGDAQGMNVTAVLRALGWRTAGKGRTTDGAALEACLTVMRAEGRGILSALAMRAPSREVPGAFMWQAEQERAIRDVPRGRVATGQAIWHPATSTGPVFAVTPKHVVRTDLIGLRAYLTAKYAPTGMGEVCDRVRFLAPQADDDMSAGPMVSARPAPGVRPGTVFGSVGAIAGEGKALRPQASRRRKRDGGIGSPMI